MIFLSRNRFVSLSYSKVGVTPTDFYKIIRETDPYLYSVPTPHLVYRMTFQMSSTVLSCGWRENGKCRGSKFRRVLVWCIFNDPFLFGQFNKIISETNPYLYSTPGF